MHAHQLLLLVGGGHNSLLHRHSPSQRAQHARGGHSGRCSSNSPPLALPPLASPTQLFGLLTAISIRSVPHTQPALTCCCASWQGHSAALL